MPNQPKPLIRNLSYLQNVKITRGFGEFDGWKLGEALSDVGTSVGNVANQIAASPDGGPITPPPIGKFQAVHLGNGIVNFSITDGSKIQRAIDYVVELADNSGFSNSEVVHFSPARNGRTV